MTLPSSVSVRVIGITIFIPEKECSVTLFSKGDAPKELKRKTRHISHSINLTDKYISAAFTLSSFFPSAGSIYASITPIQEFISEPYDILHCHHLNAARIAVALGSKRLDNRPILFDVHGLAGIEQKKDAKRSMRSRFLWPIRSLDEKIIFNKASGISLPSQALKEYVVDYFQIPTDRVFVIHDGTYPALFRNVNKNHQKRLKSEFDLEGKKVVMYVGEFSTIQGIEDLMNAVVLVNRQKKKNAQEIAFIFIGDGPEMPLVREYVRKFNLSNVILPGRVVYNNLPEYLSVADVAVVSSIKCPQMDLVYPLKLLDYLASGTPIVATNIKATASLLKSHDAGVLVESGKSESIAEGIMAVLDDDKLRRRIGRNGRKLAEDKFNWENSAKEAIRVYENILNMS